MYSVSKRICISVSSLYNWLVYRATGYMMQQRHKNGNMTVVAEEKISMRVYIRETIKPMMLTAIAIINTTKEKKKS